jgi:hypothetical protein
MKKTILLSLLFSSCVSSRIVQRIYEPQKGVSVQYVNNVFREANREDAFKNAEQYCSGAVKLMSEGSESKVIGISTSSYSGKTSADISNTVTLNFICEKTN